MGYMGSEDFIRLQFEEYLLSLIASVKYHIHLKVKGNDPKMLLSEIGKALLETLWLLKLVC